MTFFCCGIIGGIFGIIAIISSNNVDKYWRYGDYSEAIRQASKAKTWAIIGIILSIICLALCILVVVGSEEFSEAFMEGYMEGLNSYDSYDNYGY